VLDYTAAYGGVPAWEWDQANVARYQEMYPGVEISHRGANLYGNPVPTAFYIFLNSDRQPDVFSSFIVGSLRAQVQQGAIQPISDLWQEMGWDEQFPEPIREMATIDGEQYFVPMALQWNPIWYRTDIFEEVGLAPPQSWEQFLTACETLDAAGYIPVAAASTGWTPPLARWFTILNLRLNGAAFHEQLMAGKVRYDDPRVRAVFERWAELFAHGCFAQGQTNYREAAQQIFDGEAAMYNLGEWLSESYDEGLPATFDFFSFPTLDPDVPRAEIVHVYGAYISAAAEHPREARRFLAYLGSAPSQTSNVQTLGRVASNLAVDPSLYNEVYRRGLAFVEDAAQITTLFEFNTDAIVAGPALQAFADFWQDPSTIDETMARLERARQQAYGDVE
jgi:ABC-type glycerol-3-phosphate transport system substrate-binding protein